MVKLFAMRSLGAFSLAVGLSGCVLPEGIASVWRKNTEPTEAGAAASVGSQALHEQFVSRFSYPRTMDMWMNVTGMKGEGARKVTIDLGKQRGLFHINGEVVMDFPVCTGRKTHPTPTGSYRIIEKDAAHWSNLYDCPMPYFMRLTYDGIGLHVGQVYRYPVSHGCIRLPREACLPLFENAPMGTPVEILP